MQYKPWNDEIIHNTSYNRSLSRFKVKYTLLFPLIGWPQKVSSISGQKVVRLIKQSPKLMWEIILKTSPDPYIPRLTVLLHYRLLRCQ